MQSALVIYQRHMGYVCRGYISGGVRQSVSFNSPISHHSPHIDFLLPNTMTNGFFSSSSSHPSGFTGGVSNFISSIFGVIASLFNSILALFQAFLGLGLDVVRSALTIAQHFVAMVVDVFSGTIGFIAGTPFYDEQTLYLIHAEI